MNETLVALISATVGALIAAVSAYLTKVTELRGKMRAEAGSARLDTIVTHGLEDLLKWLEVGLRVARKGSRGGQVLIGYLQSEVPLVSGSRVDSLLGTDWVERLERFDRSLHEAATTTGSVDIEVQRELALAVSEATYYSLAIRRYPLAGPVRRWIWGRVVQRRRAKKGVSMNTK